MDNQLFLNGLIYLAAAAIAAPLGRRLGLGAVLGYLIIGAIVGPSALALVGENRDFVRRIGLKCYYGDATRPGLLKAAGAEDAELLVIAINDEDASMSIIESCRKHFPHLKVLTRACSRDHAYRLHEVGVEFFIEQLGSSLDCAIATLVALGHAPEHAKDAARRFKIHEMESIEKIAPHRHDETRIIGLAQQHLQDLDSLLLNAPLPVGRKRER